VPQDQRGPVDRTDDSRHENLHARVTTALGARTTLRLSGGIFHEDRTFGTALSVATRTIGHSASGVEHQTTRGDRLDAQLFAQWQTFRNFTSQITPSPVSRLGEFRDRIQVIPSNDFGGSSQFAMALDVRNRVVVGGDARAIIGESEEQLFTQIAPIGSTIAGGKQVGGGAFVQWIATPSERLTLIPSLRMDWWKNFEGRIVSVAGAVSHPRDNVETALNPKFAGQYALNNEVRISASFYRAFRAPTLNELYRGFGFGGFSFLPNESLGPERLIGGSREVEPLIPLQDELNTRLCDRANRVTMQSFRMWLAKGIENFAENPVGPGQMWSTDNPDASIEAFGGDADSPSERQHIEELREALDKASGVTPAAAGHIKARVGNLTSENALRISLMGTIAKTKRKRITYGTGIAKLCELILHALDVHGLYRTSPAERNVDIVWSDPIAADESRKLADAIAKAQLGVPAGVLRAELGYPDTTD
jgi:hypothetical protein